MRMLSRGKPCGGQSVVELALILPLLVLFLLGVVDICRAIYAYNAIANMSREGANLASRPVSVVGPPLDLQGIMDSLANAAPLNMQKNGMMYISEVQGGSDSTTLTTTGWQNHTGPTPQVTITSLPQKLGGINIRDGDTVYLFEIFYKMDGLFLPFISKNLHTTAIFK